MARHMYFVFTNAVEGREAEFNDWYDNRHVPDVLKVPGILSAHRFELSAYQRSGMPHPYRYAALYEIETDDLESVAKEIGRRAGTDAMFMSDAMASARETHFYKPLHPTPTQKAG